MLEILVPMKIGYLFTLCFSKSGSVQEKTERPRIRDDDSRGVEGSLSNAMNVMPPI